MSLAEPIRVTSIGLCGLGALILASIPTGRAITTRPGRQRNKKLRSENKKLIYLTSTTALLSWLATGSIILAALSTAFTLAVVSVGKKSKTTLLRRQLLSGWPRVLDEIRIRVATLGEPIPQAMFESAKGFEPQAAAIFDSNRVGWNLSGDFATVALSLQKDLDDARSQSVIQTLLLCHEMPSISTEARIDRLRSDRTWDLETSKEVESKLAGAVFARRFVLIVPVGMALAGAAIGGGRAAFSTTVGLTLSAFALLVLLLCWIWSSKLLGVPETETGLSSLFGTENEERASERI